MKFSSLFIDRPVLALVTNIGIILFGLVSVRNLGVRDFPAVDPPIITVRTSYPGAAADIIESKITKVLEESINSIGGIRTLSSTSSDGSSRITVEFNLGTDMEAAANDVRDRVSEAQHELPFDADIPAVRKADADAGPIILLTLQSATKTPSELTDYANLVFKQQLQTINQVSEVNIWGEKRYAVRIWLDPGKMTARLVTPQDVKTALEKENIELPSGSIEGATTELSVRTMGSLSSISDFNNLIIRQTETGLIRLKDIGEAVEGIENLRTTVKRDGVPMVGIAISPQSGANHISIANEFYKRLEMLKKDLPPDIKLGIGFDITKNIRKSITEVIETILIAFLLVVMVIFFFLRQWRATLIPVLAMPISLIGAFFIMYLSNFSINILTLLSIVLATGLVVDDAIVVLENIYQKIERGIDPLTSGHKGSSEIFFAIIATTLAILAVMLPIMLMPGMNGRLFREFGATLSGAVFISAFVSLSLTPMLCSRLLHHHDPQKKTFYTVTEPFFEGMLTSYKKGLEFFLRHRPLTLIIVLVSLVLIGWIYTILPSELAPLEDKSRLGVSITGAEGASYDYMYTVMDSIYQQVNKSVPERDAIITQVPGGYGGGSGYNSGSINIMLVDPEKRTRSQQEIAASLTAEMKKINKVRAFVSQEQTIGRRGGQPIQYVLMTQDIDTLKEKIPQFIKLASEDPTFQTVDVNMKFNKPQIRIFVDREKARDLGVSVSDISQTLQLALSGSRYGYVQKNSEQYLIIGQFSRQDRNKPMDLTSLSVRNREGNFVQLDNMVRVVETSNPPQLYHFNRTLSATISASLSPGKTIADGIEQMDKISKQTLGESFQTALSGPSRDFVESSSNLKLTFFFALVLIYLVLAAQFESFRNPFIVMFTVPLALAGALLSLWYCNQTLNLFSQIGIIMLIGLVAKNGILIVEFANQRRQAGMELYPALIEASVSRFRPIVMTSLTVMLGSLPIALALGAGAKSRVSLGIAIIGGLMFALVLSLFVVPVIYTYLTSKKVKIIPSL